jgi:hypothetical protein
VRDAPFALPAGRGSVISGQLKFAVGAIDHEDQACRTIAGSSATTAQVLSLDRGIPIGSTPLEKAWTPAAPSKGKTGQAWLHNHLVEIVINNTITKL